MFFHVPSWSNSMQAWIRRVCTTSSSKTSTSSLSQYHSRKSDLFRTSTKFVHLTKLLQTTNRRLPSQRRVRDPQLSQDVYKQHLSRQDHQPERSRSGPEGRQTSRSSTRCGGSRTSTFRRRALGCAECDHHAAHIRYQQIVHGQEFPDSGHQLDEVGEGRKDAQCG